MVLTTKSAIEILGGGYGWGSNEVTGLVVAIWAMIIFGESCRDQNKEVHYASAH